MTDFYLITGFLGAGKTTLLRALLPLFADQRIRLIINEFGKVGLDGAILSSYQADVAQIVNGSIFCVCRLDQFETALDEAVADAPDVIFVETSGLSDPGSIRSILAAREQTGALRYRGAICLVDALRFQKVLETARACKKQLAVADLVLINKCDRATEDELAEVERVLAGICLAPRLRTSFGKITKEQLESLQPMDHAAILDHRPDLTLQKEQLCVSPEATSSQVNRMLALLAEDTYRIKGFLVLRDGRFVADCVGAEVRVSPYGGRMENENLLTLLAGEGMPLRKAIRQLEAEFEEMVTWQKGNQND